MHPNLMITQGCILKHGILYRLVRIYATQHNFLTQHHVNGMLDMASFTFNTAILSVGAALKHQEVETTQEKSCML